MHVIYGGILVWVLGLQALVTFLAFCLFLFFETRFLYVAPAVLELTEACACLCLPSAGIKGVRHLHTACLAFLMWVLVAELRSSQL